LPVNRTENVGERQVDAGKDETILKYADLWSGLLHGRCLIALRADGLWPSLQKKARLRQARRLLIVPFKTKSLNIIYSRCHLPTLLQVD